MKIGVSGPILAQKNINGYMKKYIHNPQDGRKILWKLFIFMEQEPFYYYSVINKTLIMSNVKYKQAYIKQY